MYQCLDPLCGWRGAEPAIEDEDAAQPFAHCPECEGDVEEEPPAQ